MISDKESIRKLFLNTQKSLNKDELNKKSISITNNFFQFFDLKSIEYLHIFLPIVKFNEINTNFIIERLRKDFPFVKIIIPKTDLASYDMIHFLYNDQIILNKNKWDILEPVDGETVSANVIDMVVVPLLAVDSEGYRVGYGKGFYDRFLAECKNDIKKIGLSYNKPIDRIVDINKYDIRLNCCVTPDKVYSF